MPAWTMIFPGHCTIMFPPAIVMLAPPAVDKLMLFAAAQSMCALALITLISSRACTLSHLVIHNYGKLAGPAKNSVNFQ